MSCSDDTATILSCIQAVCAAAAAQVAGLTDLGDATQALEDALAAGETTLDCVLNGAAGATCSGMPTLAGALADLTADSIASIAIDTDTATAAQTAWTLAAAPASSQHLDVAVNGAHLQPSTDYTLAGAIVTFNDALTLGDELTAWTYST